MNVSGLTSSTLPLSSTTSATSASKRLRKRPARGLSARASTTAKPTLCRVPWYSAPGLPRPTTIFMSSPRLLLLLGFLGGAAADDLGLGRLGDRRRGGLRLDLRRRPVDHDG